MYYIPKGLAVTVEQMDEDFELHTTGGTEFGIKGDYLASNVRGNQKILAKEYFEDEYIPVDIKSPQKSKQQLSPFEEQYMALASNTGNYNLNQEEDESYINGEDNGWGLDNK